MNRYTNFILTVIAVALIGILFKGEIIKPAQAIPVYIGEVFIEMDNNNAQRAKELRRQHKVLERNIKDKCG